MREHLQDEVAGRSGDPQEIYKPIRFDGSFRVLLIAFLTGSGPVSYLKRAWLHCSCCLVTAKIHFLNLQLENSFYPKTSNYHVCSTIFSNIYCLCKELRQLILGEIIWNNKLNENNMLYETAICRPPGIGSPNYFHAPDFTKVPLPTRSQDFPLKRAPQTGWTVTLSSSSWISTFYFTSLISDKPKIDINVNSMF